ncbi:MAG: hypothetical protein IPN94_00260 [Sphingobacteriales bacterium]|nr:hypothetical protein [Sphingobacteriales bacterium]
MSTQVFIALPSQYNNEQSLEKVGESLLKIKTLANKYNKYSINWLYDQNTVLIFIEEQDACKELISDIAASLDIEDFRLIANAWQDSAIQIRDCRYIEWNWESGCIEVSGYGLAEITERKILAENNLFLYFDLEANITRNRAFIPILKDALHIARLPILQCIDTVRDIEGLQTWLYTNFPDEFSLQNTNRFERTNYIYTPSRQRIYKDIQKGYYWYFDFYHKNHYEVFDSTGDNHLGKADLNGDLIPNTADSNKKLGDYLS